MSKRCFTYVWFGALFCRGLQCTAPATKTEPEAFEMLRLPHGIIIMSKIKHDDRFTKRDFRPFRNVVQVHQIQRLHEKWPPKPPLILTHVTPANVLATSRKYQKVPRRPCGWASVRRKTTCQTSKCPEMPRLPHKMAIAQKTSTKPRWSNETFGRDQSASRILPPQMDPDLTPGLNTYRKNPSVWTHCLGNSNMYTPKEYDLVMLGGWTTSTKMSNVSHIKNL